MASKLGICQTCWLLFGCAVTTSTFLWAVCNHDRFDPYRRQKSREVMCSGQLCSSVSIISLQSEEIVTSGSARVGMGTATLIGCFHKAYLG